MGMRRVPARAQCTSQGRGLNGWSAPFVVGARVFLALLSLVARLAADEPEAKTSAPSSPSPSAPTTGTPAAPAAAADTSTEALLKRLQELEQANRELRSEMQESRDLKRQLDDLSKKYDELSRKLEPAPPRPNTPRDRERNRPIFDAPNLGSPARPAASGRTGAGNAPSRTPGAGQDVGNRHLGRIPLGVAAYDYDREGFLFSSDDDELQLKVRGLFQGDYHHYTQTNQTPVTNGVYVPRVRLYFQGRLSKPFEYEISFQRGYDNFDLLNAYINFNFSDYFKLRFGRYKTPYTYEYYHAERSKLLLPERSVYNLNFQGNRQVGLMAHGSLFDHRFEYAVGAFDGAPNSYQPFNGTPALISLLRFKPWANSDSVLRNLDFGGSVYAANVTGDPVRPPVLRTNDQLAGSRLDQNVPSNASGLPFLAFNDNVVMQGERTSWDAHVAYFWKRLAMLAAYDDGFVGYAVKGDKTTHLRVNGYYVQAAYFLTGETLNDFSWIDPIRPFDPSHGKYGPGAIQPTARFATINLGDEVFSNGLADANLWTNHAYVIDAGVVWYWNRFTKLFLIWEHAEFANPVYYRPNGLQLNSDLFWLRMQFHF